jgi:hypothetical protein
MFGLFDVVVVRPVWIAGVACMPGSRARLPGATAFGLWDSGQIEFVKSAAEERIAALEKEKIALLAKQPKTRAALEAANSR